jgi:transcriptional regulator with XRE-family HTH domain
MLFGQSIRLARKVAGLTIEEAAERADISANYLGQLERGKRVPSFETILGLAIACKVRPAAFFKGTECPRAEDLRSLCTDTLAKCTPEQLRILYRVLLAANLDDR